MTTTILFILVGILFIPVIAYVVIKRIIAINEEADKHDAEKEAQEK